MRESYHPHEILDTVVQPSNGKELDRAELHAAELAKIEMATLQALRPSQENVARRLHEALSNHDSLTVVLVYALVHIGLPH